MGRDSLGFDFHHGFGEIAEEVWGVWVGEHGFLTAVFTSHEDAVVYSASLKHDDWSIDKIKLHTPLFT